MKYVEYEVSLFETDRILVWDWSRGEIIDVETGEVVDRIYVNEIPMREDGNRLVPDIEFITPANEIHPLHLPWSSYMFLEEIVNTFSRLKESYPVYCPTYLFERTIRKYLKKIKNTTNLNKKEFIGAFIYIALEENNTPVDIYDLSKVLGIRYSDLKSAILYIKNILGKNCISFEEKTRRYINIYGQRLNLEPKIIADALDIYDKIRITGRFTPRIIALTMLYISLLKNGKKPKALSSVVNLFKIKRTVERICKNYSICEEIL